VSVFIPFLGLATNPTTHKEAMFFSLIGALSKVSYNFSAKPKTGLIELSARAQLVFFEMEPSAAVPEHTHGYPQWGMVIDGEGDLIIDGKSMICTKGTEYPIPAGAKHYARFNKKTRVVDFFSEKSRYRKKRSR
jgi:quercetin dioxygenase-like cupin family protein